MSGFGEEAVGGVGGREGGLSSLYKGEGRRRASRGRAEPEGERPLEIRRSLQSELGSILSGGEASQGSCQYN